VQIAKQETPVEKPKARALKITSVISISYGKKPSNLNRGRDFFSCRSGAGYFSGY